MAANSEMVTMSVWFQQLFTRHIAKLGFALLFFIVGMIISKGIRNILNKAFLKFKIEEHIAGFFSKMIYIFLMTVLLITTFSMIGLPMAPFITVFGSLLLAVGLALKGDLSNVASGILIFIFRPYRVGEFVSQGNFSGTVKEISFLTTKLLSVDGQMHIVPNSKMTNDVVTNYSVMAQRRMNFTVQIAMTADLDLAKSLIREVLEKDHRVLRDKDILVVVKGWEKNSVQLGVMAWTQQKDFWNTSYEVLELMVRRFQEASIPMAAELWTNQNQEKQRELS